MNVDENFKASDWITAKFQNTEWINLQKAVGRKLFCKPQNNKKLLHEYNEDNIFNDDETSTFYKLLPKRSLVSEDEICCGTKQAKIRLTVLLITANMFRIGKQPQFIIGNSKNCHCFNGIKTLLVDYKENKKV